MEAAAFAAMWRQPPVGYKQQHPGGGSFGIPRQQGGLPWPSKSAGGDPCSGASTYSVSDASSEAGTSAGRPARALLQGGAPLPGFAAPPPYFAADATWPAPPAAAAQGAGLPVQLRFCPSCGERSSSLVAECKARFCGFCGYDLVPHMAALLRERAAPPPQATAACGAGQPPPSAGGRPAAAPEEQGAPHLVSHLRRLRLVEAKAADVEGARGMLCRPSALRLPRTEGSASPGVERAPRACGSRRLRTSAVPGQCHSGAAEWCVRAAAVRKRADKLAAEIKLLKGRDDMDGIYKGVIDSFQKELDELRKKLHDAKPADAKLQIARLVFVKGHVEEPHAAQQRARTASQFVDLVLELIGEIVLYLKRVGLLAVEDLGSDQHFIKDANYSNAFLQVGQDGLLDMQDWHFFEAYWQRLRELTIDDLAELAEQVAADGSQYLTELRRKLGFEVNGSKSTIVITSAHAGKWIADRVYTHTAQRLQEVGEGELFAVEVMLQHAVPPFTVYSDYQDLLDGWSCCIAAFWLARPVDILRCTDGKSADPSPFHSPRRTQMGTERQFGPDVEPYGPGGRTLTGALLEGYAAADQEITMVPLTLLAWQLAAAPALPPELSLSLPNPRLLPPCAPPPGARALPARRGPAAAGPREQSRQGQPGQLTPQLPREEVLDPAPAGAGLALAVGLLSGRVEAIGRRLEADAARAAARDQSVLGALRALPYTAPPAPAGGPAAWAEGFDEACGSEAQLLQMLGRLNAHFEQLQEHQSRRADDQARLLEEKVSKTEVLRELLSAVRALSSPLSRPLSAGSAVQRRPRYRAYMGSNGQVCEFPEVAIATKLYQVSNVDTAALSFEVDFVVRLEWRDDNLEGIPCEEFKSLDWAQYFNPHLEIDNDKDNCSWIEGMDTIPRRRRRLLSQDTTEEMRASAPRTPPRPPRGSWAPTSSGRTRTPRLPGAVAAQDDAVPRPARHRRGGPAVLPLRHPSAADQAAGGPQPQHGAGDAGGDAAAEGLGGVAARTTAGCRRIQTTFRWSPGCGARGTTPSRPPADRCWRVPDSWNHRLPS
ncbi:unnamed protein product [Prorocentrum cordatum]|uniref:Uncharacterized protein n=1 Tax=Prorocentrum cordatum TaxID=2364126 RepID=A0ABN9VXL8_9DINO|nr:unnamed protein product [Polarella glacialis]